MAATSSEKSRANPDQIIVGMLRDVHEGETFERIPEHVTLLHWFSLNGKYQGAFENALMNRLHFTEPIELVGERRQNLGPNEDTPATILEMGSLASFHAMAFELVERFDGTVHSEYTRKLYLPHVTDTDTYRFSVGERQKMKSVQLVSMDRETGLRKVERVLSLSGGKHGEPTARH